MLPALTYPSSSRRAANRGSEQGTGGGTNMRRTCAASNFHHQTKYNRNTKWNILSSSWLLSGSQNGDKTWLYKDNAQRIATPESRANDRQWGTLDTIPNIHDKP
jgi:hypothetical protein